MTRLAYHALKKPASMLLYFFMMKRKKNSLTYLVCHFEVVFLLANFVMVGVYCSDDDMGYNL